ncbi:ABC transporter ATP-binding protein [Helicobacter didelphidarum]|uniref:ABC transporter ATP-binding protein n=1 Tax=Helicobacter didelphidarum TaxID=2040648 RepID=A0A3D8IPL1_9HELI|nr:ABC-F family ATP-binding cassette domain-containing protein [Helicobacter didelphidarum]RDU67043.1 ABC transporter ATP-binding protein [Helicobacter didelphidarum]
MALLSLLEISKHYNTKILLQEISFNINEHEKIAIIGKNGCGKSTLLKIIEGSITQDFGQRIVKNNLEILSLPQNITFSPKLSVKEVLESQLYNLQTAHKRLQEIAHIPNFTDSKVLSQEYNTLNDYIDRHDGWDLESKINLIMQHFELESFANRLAISLSGGEQKRIALTSLLLKSADILLLDEPTNHLDVEMVEFLENYLKQMKASIIFISHDRYFIENIATRIIELDNAKLHSFEGGYLSYLQTKRQMLENLEKENELLKKILKTEEKWLQRGVQARRKRNEGRKARVLELKAKVKSIPSLVRNIHQTLEKTLHDLPKDSIKNTRKMLFEMNDFHLSIQNKKLITNLNIRIMQQEKLAIVGKNGSGKTTFLSYLLHTNKADLESKNTSYSGIFKKGDITIGYFDQHKKMLDDSKTLIETFCPNGGDRVSVRGKNIHVYGYLKSFLFPQEDLEKKIGLLSGGEKSRVALALLFSKQYDCLILDEPTNDLDIATMNILEDYLQHSECAIIFVSHDRYFVDKIAQRLLILGQSLEISDSVNKKIQQEKLQNYLITYAKYSEFLEIQNEIKELQSFQNIRQDSNNSLTTQNILSHTDKKDSNTPSKNPQKKKLSYKDKIEYDDLEEQIQNLEMQICELERRLSIPSEYEKYGIQTLSQELEETKTNLEKKWQRYEELSIKLES